MSTVVPYQNELEIKRSYNALILKNRSKKSITLKIVLAGSKAFSIPEKYLKVRIKPNSYAKIPLKFRERCIGWPIALSAIHRASIQLWKEDGKRKTLVESIRVDARAPLCVPKLRCMDSTERKGQYRKSNSSPVIVMTAVKPRTTVTKNTGEVELSWEISGADEIDDWISHPDIEVLEPGSLTAGGGEECYPHETPARNTYTYTAGPTLTQTLEARNDDGVVYEHETIYWTAPVGYHNARCPAGGQIHTDELGIVRGFLEDIDARLRADALVHLPEFIEEWNNALNERDDIPEDMKERFRFPYFDDMAYLSGPVGSGNLADQILNSMRDVLIYTKPSTLPRGYRPGTLHEGRLPLCYDGGRVAGKTAYFARHPDCNWIAICLEFGADGLTLLHELYHYTTGMGDDDYEKRAVAVSNCCYDNIPW